MRTAESLKILHIYKDYYPILGGIENHVKTLAEAQVQAGHHVTVLVTNPGRQPGQVTMNGVNVRRVWRVATIASTPISPVFPLALARLQPDITHLHFPYPVGEFSQLLMSRNRPFVITYHSDIVRQKAILRFYKPLLQKILHQAARIMPTSDRYVETSPYLTPQKHKCSVVPLSVDPRPFQEAVPILAAGEKPTLLFVGRHRYYKGLETLLKAMPQVDARLIVGGDGPMRAEWEQQARDLNLNSKVQFIGKVSDSDLPGLYTSADIFVLPASARAEAFGKVLLEAMAAGLPCVTTEIGTGTSYVVQHGKTGLVVPPESPEALTVALKKLIASPSLRSQMGKTGKERVLREFTVEKMVGRVQAIYDDVLNPVGERIRGKEI